MGHSSADAGHQHASAHVREKFTTIPISHGTYPPGKWSYAAGALTRRTDDRKRLLRVLVVPHPTGVCHASAAGSRLHACLAREVRAPYSACNSSKSASLAKGTIL